MNMYTYVYIYIHEYVYAYTYGMRCVFIYIYIYTYICDKHVRSYIITHMSKRSAIITICEVPPPMNPSFLNLEPTVQEMHNHSTNVCVTMKELGGQARGITV